MADRRTKGGYESGDTPASELLGRFPEVLTRPGLGMPPETVTHRSTEDAAPKVPILSCPKCGEPDTSLRWCHGGYSLAHGQCVETGDHFHRGCPRCSYRWATFDVLA